MCAENGSKNKNISVISLFCLWYACNHYQSIRFSFTTKWNFLFMYVCVFLVVFLLVNVLFNLHTLCVLKKLEKKFLIWLKIIENRMHRVCLSSIVNCSLSPFILLFDENFFKNGNSTHLKLWIVQDSPFFYPTSKWQHNRKLVTMTINCTPHCFSRLF